MAGDLGTVSPNRGYVSKVLQKEVSHGNSRFEKNLTIEMEGGHGSEAGYDENGDRERSNRRGP